MRISPESLRVNASWQAVRRWLAHNRLSRLTTEALFRAWCRQHLARLERVDSSRCQLRTLLSLVHHAHRSAFGRDHDFYRIRTVDDFRRLVPLRTSAELRGFPTPPVVSGPDAARLSAVTTALAIVACARPHARLFDGTTLLLGDDLTLPDNPNRILPMLVRPYANVRGRTTCLIGSADRLARYLDICRPDDRVTPAAVLYTPSPGVSRDRLRARLSSRVLLLELAFRAEAAVAIEDPQHHLPRLLTDHGVYYEFVPAAERNALSPPRLSIDQVEAGETYELVITAPGGWWACRTETGVRFERRDLPLVRFVPLPVFTPAPLSQTESAGTVAVSPFHPRMAGIPAMLPGSFVHTPWSAPVDRE